MINFFFSSSLCEKETKGKIYLPVKNQLQETAVCTRLCSFSYHNNELPVIFNINMEINIHALPELQKIDFSTLFISLGPN